MSVNSGKYLEATYDSVRALGEKIVASDGMIVIKGHEEIRLLIKQFPWPVATIYGELMVPTPLGAELVQPQQRKVAQSGQMTMLETTGGHVQRFMEKVIGGPKWGYFDATVYEGTVDNFRSFHEIRDCIWIPENMDRDWENRAQIVQVSGTMHFHYFGKRVVGAVTDGS